MQWQGEFDYGAFFLGRSSERLWTGPGLYEHGAPAIETRNRDHIAVIIKPHTEQVGP